jgi:hypothetical protein
MLRLWPGKIDSAFIGKRRRSRQFYPLAAFSAAAALGISMGVPGLSLQREIVGTFPLSGLTGKLRLPSRPRFWRFPAKRAEEAPFCPDSRSQ